MFRELSLVAATFLCVAATVESAQGAELTPRSVELSVSGECGVSKDDAEWIEASITAWKTMRSELIASDSMPSTTVVLFDDKCVYRANSLRFDEQKVSVTATRHAGRIKLPSGRDVAAGVTSFAAPIQNESVFFVMALPSIWRASGMQFKFDMGSFLTAVMIHEISHVVQFQTYLKKSAAVEGIELLGMTVNDDIIQDRFASNTRFKASIDEEVTLLFSAAKSASVDECKTLARRSLALMRARQATYYVGDLRALAKLEDLFLTLEGSGQFAAVAWLSHPGRGAIPPETALSAFGESSKFWSQRHGLALFLVLDRTSPNWRTIVYGEGDRTALQLLEEAL